MLFFLFSFNFCQVIYYVKSLLRRLFRICALRRRRVPWRSACELQTCLQFLKSQCTSIFSFQSQHGAHFFSGKFFVTDIMSSSALLETTSPHISSSSSWTRPMAASTRALNRKNSDKSAP